MIYLSVFSRRLSQKGEESWKAWSKVCSRFWQPIGTSLAIIGSGFGIFLLSAFPPTQRFGFSVVFGSAVSILVALFLFPWLTTLSFRRIPSSRIVESLVKAGEPHVD
ncbi:MAG: hypothetical protein HY583_00270 [Candidatus Omnitrophica bacterium]|nr:hypothetical protein [Candidatus Omnitrophota bacterium]